jgi:hypothetical protein
MRSMGELNAEFTEQRRAVMASALQNMRLSENLIYLSSINFLKTNHHFPHNDFYVA